MLCVDRPYACACDCTVGVCKWLGTLIVGGGGCATYWLVLCSVDSRSTMTIRASFSLLTLEGEQVPGDYICCSIHEDPNLDPYVV